MSKEINKKEVSDLVMNIKKYYKSNNMALTDEIVKKMSKVFDKADVIWLLPIFCGLVLRENKYPTSILTYYNILESVGYKMV